MALTEWCAGIGEEILQDKLAAKDAEIARLKEERQHLFTLYPQRHKDGSPCSDPDCQRAHALREWLVAAVEKRHHDDQATIARLQADLAALREAVAELPKYECAEGYKCDLCAFANAALAAARKLAGME